MPKTRSVIFPDKLNNAVAKAAKADRRSFSAWVVLACETMLAKEWTWTVGTGTTEVAGADLSITSILPRVVDVTRKS